VTPDPESLRSSGTVDLVSGLVEDARDLVGAHVEALRDDLSVRLVTLGATLGTMLIAIAVFVVTALLLCLATAATLVAIGAPWWLALWSVTVAAAAIGIWFVFRARTKARTIAPLPAFLTTEETP
jgi:hypothetical protein